MLKLGFSDMLGSPEEALAFACSDCESGHSFCVVFDSEKGLLRLLPRENVLQSEDYRVIDLTTFINTMESPMDQSY